MFVDEAVIFVEGGRGNDGCASMRREKYRPHGGPDGGDGGAGGDVLLVASPGRGTLSEFNKKRHYRAQGGGRGGPKNKSGRRGTDLTIPVPLGTVVRDDQCGVLADLVDAGQEFCAARGGRGGRGNASLVGGAGPLPRFSERGEPGESSTVRLELKLVADVAIVGFPNAGKSTLISRISGARPKIADYPFTTTEPNLGVVEGDEFDFVVTDVPGLVKGAHQGKGMGIDFLRHIERASIIVYLVDVSPFTGRDPGDDLVLLEEELRLFNPRLADRKKVSVANKMDLSPKPETLRPLGAECEARGLSLYRISAVTGEGISRLVRDLEVMVEKERKEGAVTGTNVTYAPQAGEDMMSVTREGDRFVVKGRRVERMVLMTDWGNDEAREHLASKLRRSGVEEMLAREGASAGDEVEVAGRVFEYFPEVSDGPHSTGSREEPVEED